MKISAWIALAVAALLALMGSIFVVNEGQTGMVLNFGIYFLWIQVFTTAPDSAWATVTKHMNFILLWDDSMDGILMPRYLLFHLSITIIWLFLTVKVLEARRWA